MENMRGQESRGGRPGGSSAGDRSRTQIPTGFEGMNYEQKREPYKNLSNIRKAEKEHASGNNGSDNREAEE